MENVNRVQKNVYRAVVEFVLHALIISRQSVLLALDLQFCLEENVLLTRVVIKQALAMIVELDSISTNSIENAIHAPLLQI